MNRNLGQMLHRFLTPRGHLRWLPRFALVPRFAGLAVLALLTMSALFAAEPLTMDGGGPAPELLTDRMQILFDTFDEQAALGQTPSSVTVAWDDFAYTLSAADYLAYREGERNFLETVAQVRIARTPFWSPRVLWRKYGLALSGCGLLAAFGFALFVAMRRRKARRVSPPHRAAPLPAPSAPPAAVQASPILCLYPLVGSPHALEAECTTIGSQEGNLLRLSNRGVAPHHARIWRTREGAWFVEDLGSPFGTLVNGQPVSRQWLQAGATLGIGEWQARVEWAHAGIPMHSSVSAAPIPR
jgi:hypothetical protein